MVEIEADNVTTENGTIDMEALADEMNGSDFSVLVEQNAEAIGRQLTGEQIGLMLGEAVNTGITGPDVGANLPHHRYLQSELYKDVVKPIVMGLASNDYDLRNEKAVKECREMCEAIGWDYDEVPFPE